MVTCRKDISYLFFSAIFRDKATWDVSQSSETCIIFSNVKDDEIIYLENLYCSCPSYETYYFSWRKRLTCALKVIHSFCFHDSYLLKPTCITRKKPFIRFSSLDLWENRFESWEVKEQYLMKPVLGRGVFNTLILRFLNNKTFMGYNTKCLPITSPRLFT